MANDIEESKKNHSDGNATKFSTLRPCGLGTVSDSVAVFMQDSSGLRMAIVSFTSLGHAPATESNAEIESVLLRTLIEWLYVSSKSSRFDQLLPWKSAFRCDVEIKRSAL